MASGHRVSTVFNGQTYFFYKLRDLSGGISKGFFLGGQWRVFVFKQPICYLFLKAKAKGGAKGGGRRVALLEEVGVEVGAFAEPLHEVGGPAGGTCDANELQVVSHCLLPLTEVEGAEVDSGIEDVKDSAVAGKRRCRPRRRRT